MPGDVIASLAAASMTGILLALLALAVEAVLDPEEYVLPTPTGSGPGWRLAAARDRRNSWSSAGPMVSGIQLAVTTPPPPPEILAEFLGVQPDTYRPRPPVFRRRRDPKRMFLPVSRPFGRPATPVVLGAGVTGELHDWITRYGSGAA